MSDDIKHLATTLLKEGFQYPTVAHFTGLSEAEIDQLRVELGISMDALDVPENLFQRVNCEDKHMRARLRSRKKYLTDLLSNLETARDRGIAKGMAQVLAEGKAEGKAKIEVEVAKKLPQRDIPLDEIAEITDLSIEEIRKLCSN